MTFASVYPLYLAKVEKKGRTKEELQQVIAWLTGFNNKKLQELIEEKVTFETFFQRASLNPNTHLITGVICGYRGQTASLLVGDEVHLSHHCIKTGLVKKLNKQTNQFEITGDGLAIVTHDFLRTILS